MAMDRSRLSRLSSFRHNALMVGLTLTTHLVVAKDVLAQPPLPGVKGITVELKAGPPRHLEDSYAPVEADAEIQSPSNSIPRPPVNLLAAPVQGPFGLVRPQPPAAPLDPRTPWTAPTGGMGWGIEDKIEYPTGKKVYLRINDTNEFSHVARLERLQPLDPNDVHGLHFQGEMQLKSLRMIAKYTQLRVLAVGACMAIESDKGAAELAKLKNLEYIYLYERGNPVYGDDKFCDALLGMKKLRFLSVPADRITDGGLEKLSKHPTLEELEIRGKRTKLTGAALRSLAKLPKLRYLAIACTKDVSNNDVRSFANCKDLRVLGLITSAELTSLEQVNSKLPGATFYMEPPKPGEE